MIAKGGSTHLEFALIKRIAIGTKMLPIVNSLADFGNYYKSIIEKSD